MTALLSKAPGSSLHHMFDSILPCKSQSICRQLDLFSFSFDIPSAVNFTSRRQISLRAGWPEPDQKMLYIWSQKRLRIVKHQIFLCSRPQTEPNIEARRTKCFYFFLNWKVYRSKGKEIIMILKLKVFRYWNCLLSGYFMFAIGWVHQVIISCVELYSQVKLQTETEFHTSCYTFLYSYNYHQ